MTPTSATAWALNVLDAMATNFCNYEEDMVLRARDAYVLVLMPVSVGFDLH